jgi:hypothetical protein
MHINEQQLTKNLQKSRNFPTKHGKQMQKWKWRNVGTKILKNLVAH